MSSGTTSTVSAATTSKNTKEASVSGVDTKDKEVDTTKMNESTKPNTPSESTSASGSASGSPSASGLGYVSFDAGDDAVGSQGGASNRVIVEGGSGELKVGFIGGGKMALALATGFVKNKLIQGSNIVASDTSGRAAETFKVIPGVKTTTSNKEVMENCDIIFVAVKPYIVPRVFKADIKPNLNPTRHVIVSVAAGVSLSSMTAWLDNSEARLVRVMPNTPALVGASASAYCVKPSPYAENDAKVVDQLLSSVGIVSKVEEKYLDAITGVSGSGPAYIYMVIEAMSDGGVAAGLPRDLATKFAAQTVFGAAKMVLETGLHPAVLKDMVTSPGGTTIEAIHELEKGGLRATMMNGVRVASHKAHQLAVAASEEHK